MPDFTHHLSPHTHHSSLLCTMLQPPLYLAPEPDYLLAVRRFTNEAYAQGAHMLSGWEQGSLLAWLARLKQPKLVAEIGTFTGYSALWLAQGLAPGGKLITLERDARLQKPVRELLDASPHGHQIEMRIGEALPLLETIEGPIDMAFIDADKRSYHLYLERLLDRMPAGGLILMDNVLWKGRLEDEAYRGDAITEYFRAFNLQVAQHPRLYPLMFPLRDGLWGAMVRG